MFKPQDLGHNGNKDSPKLYYHKAIINFLIVKRIPTPKFLKKNH